MSLVNFASSILQLTTTVNGLVGSVSEIANTLSRVKQSITMIALKMDVNPSGIQVTSNNGTSAAAVLPVKVPVKKLSFIECEGKMSNFVLSLEVILKTFPVIEKISYE